MTTIYVASFATVIDFECLRDDRGYDTVTDMAHGYTCGAGTDLDKVIADAKAKLTAEMIDVEELTADDELTYEVEASSFGNCTITASCGVDVIGVIVIRPFDAA